MLYLRQSTQPVDGNVEFFVVRLRSTRLSVSEVVVVCNSIHKRPLEADELRELSLPGREDPVFISRLAANQIVWRNYDHIDTIPVEGTRIFIYE